MRRALLAVFFAIGIAAQAPPPLVETIEVRVVNVDVIVTDRHGNRIHGLTQDDFELFDQGRRQVITNFSEIHDERVAIAESASAPSSEERAARRRNTVVFFIDTSSIDARRRHRVFDEMRRFAADALLPGDRAMVAVWNRSFRIVLPFSESAENVQEALAEAEQEANGRALSLERDTTKRQILDELADALEKGEGVDDAYRNGRLYARRYADQMYARGRSLLLSVTSTMTLLGGDEDRKAFVYVGESLPAKAGMDMIQFVEETFAPYHLSDHSTPEFDSLSMNKWLEKAGRSANASGVTMYMIAGGGLEKISVDPADPEPEASLLSLNAERSETIASFVGLSDQTGGVALVGGDPRKVLQQIVDDFHSYYSLGFRPGGARAGKLRVRTKNPDYVVRARESYALRTVADEMADRVAANFHQAGSRGDLLVHVILGPPVPEKRNSIRVRANVTVEGDRITLLPRGGMLVGEVTVLICGGNPDRESSKITRRTQRLEIPIEDEKRFRAGHLTFSFDVVLAKDGEKIVSVGVLDTISGLYGTARGPVLPD